jgi:SAM-dependent methyltransferase
MIWCCPRCHARISIGPSAEQLQCLQCRSTYDVIGGIPDFRVPATIATDVMRDRAGAREIAERDAELTTEELIRFILSRYSGVDDRWRAARARQIMAAPGRLSRDFASWLGRYVTPETPFLDLGCGPGTLGAAAAEHGYQSVGVDASLTWLLVARRLIQERGGTPILAAGVAEALPLADGSFSSIVALDLLEHVADPRPCLLEMDRVLRPRGYVAVVLPNRFSLAPEPHTGIWGVGWLPHRLQGRYVKWRSGRAYTLTRNLAAWGAARLMRQSVGWSVHLEAPPIPPEEIRAFPRRRARLAHIYNQLCRYRWLQPLLLSVGPNFRAIARTPGASAEDVTRAEPPYPLSYAGGRRSGDGDHT